MRKTYTFILTSDAKGKTRNLVISAAWLKALGSLAIVLMVIGAAGVVDYTGLLFQSIENKRLSAENTLLKKEFTVVENKVVTLEKQLERINSYANKLGMITNIKNKDNEIRLAMGPLPRPGQAVREMHEHVHERSPASVVVSKDKLFFQNPPLDTKKRELFSDKAENFATLSVRIDKLSKESKLKEQNILRLWESLSSRQSLLKATPQMKPTNGWYTSKFGYRKSPFTGRPVMHNGLDIAAPPGTPIFAPADGVVSYAGYDAGYGKLISIDHGYGMLTRYGHVSKIYATVGQKVKRGDVIGAVGNTGRSTGPHLHYEVRINSVPVDPSNYILNQ
ncbi:MAG: peptidoglycan DD-metalloendopeptidase family protein [Bdellovibrionales bacterium]